MPFTDDARSRHLGTRLQRVDSWEEAFAGAIAGKHNGRREMRESVNRSGIGKIVGRYINRLDRRNGARRRVCDAFFQTR